MAPNSIRMTVRWQVPPAEARSITEALHAVMDAARRERGYVNCSLSTEVGKVVLLDYREEWQSEPDLQRQIRSPRFATLTGLIERASREAAVQFHFPAHARGLDYAKAIRGGIEDDRG